MESAARKPWVVAVEKALGGANPWSEATRWRGHSIYRVPEYIRDMNRRAYQPLVVSLGPFHHGDPRLRPVEEHKRRALLHRFRRARMPLDEFATAVEEAAEQLEGAYQGLGEEWRGANRDRFLELMITDGCFLLEVMRAAVGQPGESDYAPNDPIFSAHGVRYTLPYIRRDMLMMENQLPLLVLDRLVAVESGKQMNEDFINGMVLKFLALTAPPPTPGIGLGLHPLDIYHRSLLYGHDKTHQGPAVEPIDDIIRSAMELYEAGIRFKKSQTRSLGDIHFSNGVLHLPPINIDDTTEYMFRNLMAFERLHVGAGNEVTTYVFFMDSIINSAIDVGVLTANGIIHNALGSDKAVAALFNGLCRDMVLGPGSALDDVHWQVSAYCRNRWKRWRANVIRTYFRRPCSVLSLAAAVSLLVTTVTQTVYVVMQYYKGGINRSMSRTSTPGPLSPI